MGLQRDRDCEKPVTSAVTLTNVRITACLSTPQIKFLCQIECPGHSLVGRIPFRAKFVRKQEFIYLGRYLYLYHFWHGLSSSIIRRYGVSLPSSFHALSRNLCQLLSCSPHLTPRDPNLSAYGWSRDEGRHDFQFAVYCGRNSAKPRSRPSPTRTAVWPSQILQCDLWTAAEITTEITKAEKAPLDRLPPNEFPRIKTPQPTVDRPARAAASAARTSHRETQTPGSAGTSRTTDCP